MGKTVEPEKIKESQREKGRIGQNNGRFISLNEAGFFSKIRYLQVKQGILYQMCYR